MGSGLAASPGPPGRPKATFAVGRRVQTDEASVGVGPRAYLRDRKREVLASMPRPGEGWAWSDERDQAERAISTGQLHALLRFHIRPIDVVVFHGSSGRTRFEVGFELRCLQLLS